MVCYSLFEFDIVVAINIIFANFYPRPVLDIMYYCYICVCICPMHILVYLDHFTVLNVSVSNHCAYTDLGSQGFFCIQHYSC